MSFDKRISIWDRDFVNKRKNLLNSVEDWGENHMYLIDEKTS